MDNKIGTADSQMLMCTRALCFSQPSSLTPSKSSPDLLSSAIAVSPGLKCFRVELDPLALVVWCLNQILCRLGQIVVLIY